MLRSVRGDIFITNYDAIKEILNYYFSCIRSIGLMDLSQCSDLNDVNILTITINNLIYFIIKIYYLHIYHYFNVNNIFKYVM